MMVCAYDLGCGVRVPALVAARMRPPMAGPTARARFWFTEPREIACGRVTRPGDDATADGQAATWTMGSGRRLAADSSVARGRCKSAAAWYDRFIYGAGSLVRNVRWAQAVNELQPIVG